MVRDHSDSKRENRYMGYSFHLAAKGLLYAPSCGLWYTSCGALAGTQIAQWVHYE